MEELEKQIKEQIIDALNLEGVTPEDIESTTPLFGDEGLGLDSIDALELIVIMEKNYGIKLTDPSQSRGILQTVGSMAEYISANRTK